MHIIIISFNFGYRTILFHLSIFILGSIMFHVRRRPADSHGPRRRKKKSNVSNGNSSHQHDREGPTLVEVTHSGDGGRRVKLTSEPLEVNPFYLI